MKKETKLSLLNVGAELLTIAVGIVTAVGVQTMKKGISDTIEKNDAMKVTSEQKTTSKKFWERKK